MARVTISEHNRRARTKATEQVTKGRIPALDRQRAVLVVPSASTPGRTYEVVLRLVGHHVVGSCVCQAGGTAWPAGALPCWHCAAGALVLEGSGLLAWDEETGRWVPGPSCPSHGPLTSSPPTSRIDGDAQRRERQWTPPRPGTPEHLRVISGLVD